MRRIVIGGFVLSLCGALIARSKTETLVFVFRGLDQERNVAILRPMIAPDIGVQLDKGSAKLERGAALQCQPFTRAHDALIDGQISKISEMVLHCGDHQFVVKGLDFTQRAGIPQGPKKD